MATAVPSGYVPGPGGYYNSADNSGPYAVDGAGNVFPSGQAGNLPTGALLTLTAQGLGTVNGSDQSNAARRGLHLVVDITAISGTSPTLTVTVEGKDPVSGKYYTILASAALNAVATTVLKVYPGLTAAANTVANDVLPGAWRVKAVVGGTGPSVTATIAASVID
jgi:hypothetical protein